MRAKRRPSLRLRLRMLLSALLIAGCAPQPPQDAAPGKPDLPRIVSLNPCSDAVLVEIAAPEQILALSHYSQDPRSSSIPPGLARRFRATRGSAEEVIALDPDVVVVSAFASPALRAAFEQAGIRVESFAVAQTFAQSEAQIRRIARVSHQQANGEALIARIVKAQKRAGDVTAGDHKEADALLWQQGEIVAGPEALVGELLESAGFANKAANMGLGQGDRVSLEELLADPPQRLLVAGDSAGQRHRALRKAKGMRVERFDPRLLYCAGPTVIRALERLVQIRKAQR